MFHATLLRQYKETDIYGANFPRPPPDIIKFTSQTNSETSKMRMGVPILCGVERISYFRSIMGTGAGIFRRWRPPDQLQTPPSSMTTPAVIKLPLLTFENMKMEQTWRLDNCLNQARQAWKFFEWYKNYLTTEEFPETSFSLL